MQTHALKIWLCGSGEFNMAAVCRRYKSKLQISTIYKAHGLCSLCCLLLPVEAKAHYFEKCGITCASSFTVVCPCPLTPTGQGK